ncbi:MAG: hypothetical protein ACRC6I_12660 [Paracoccaceae bacterium]
MGLPIPSPDQIINTPVRAINDKLIELRTAIGHGKDFVGKKMALEGLMYRMDPQGRELFENWLYGRVAKSDTLLLNSPEWQAYINADTSHRIGLGKRLVEVAKAQAGKLTRSNWQPRDEVFTTDGFRAYFGKKGGGYWRGYEQLHGSNAWVGGMQVKRGELRAIDGPGASSYTVTFRNLDLEFNDITDPAHGNPADSAAAGFFYGLADALEIGPPKSYATCIQWRSDLVATITLSKSDAPHTTSSIAWTK